MKKRQIVTYSVIGIICLIFIGIYFKTGFLQTSKIDSRDLEYWSYSEEGLIENAKEFIIAGSEETCWLLIHGYTSTPADMKELAFRLNKEFNETIVVPRLKGHGEVPSKILNLSLEDWYEQIEKDYEIIKLKCENINVVGFSFGGALSLKLAEEKKFNNLYLISPYLKARYKLIRIFPLENYIYVFADWTIYSKKVSVAQINSPEEAKKHIAYWNMPFQPLKYSTNFLGRVEENLPEVKETTLIQHSKGDDTADIEGAKLILEEINSENKRLIVLEDSNHVLLRDYDKEDVIENIVNFEKEVRK